MIKKNIIGITLVFLCFSITACSTPNLNSEDQPTFPSIEKYWIVDPDNYLDENTIESADKVLESLRQDHIAEVAIVIQKGIKNKGPLNDEKIWLRDWGRFVKLGDKEDQRAIVWLIRPDVKTEENRVTIEVSTHLTWLTAGDYGPILEEAAEYTNYNDINGAVESLVRNTDEVLRKLYKNEQGGN